MEKNAGSKVFQYFSQGQKLKEIVFFNASKLWKNKISLEFICEKTGMPVRTLQNIFLGKTQISLAHLICFIVALKMSVSEAYDFLDDFGISKNIFNYDCYKKYNEIILDRAIIEDDYLIWDCIKNVVSAIKADYKPS